VTDRETVLPFLKVAALWLISGLAVSAWTRGSALLGASAWLLLLWAVCLTDLYSLSRAVEALMELVSGTSENRGALVIQASYWGMIKLICLGILGLTVFYGRSIPSVSLLMGTGTLVVVPLLGGYWWSQKVLRHA
jgi:hypothetical protein